VRSFFRGPRYDCRFLHEKIKSITGGNTLTDTYTNVVVPTFDVGRLDPIIFSTFDRGAGSEVLLSDVCIGTTAAPTYFPAYHFEDYHLIDGCVGANNPTMVAITAVARAELHAAGGTNKGFHMDYHNMVVISLGTGSTRNEVAGEGTMYRAEECAKWGSIGWIINLGLSWGLMPWIFKWWARKPIVDMLMHASDFLVDFNVAMLLWTHGCKNYLRIQALEVLNHPLII
jgi:hypothetical protein